MFEAFPLTIVFSKAYQKFGALCAMSGLTYGHLVLKLAVCCQTDNPVLDRLAQLETELGKVTPEQGDDEGGPKKKTEDGEEVEDEPIEEDEDDFQDDDDYYQVICAWHSSSRYVL